MTSDTIEIRLNGEPREVDAGLSITELLARFELTPELVVVERNREIVPRARCGDTRVEAGDTFEIVHFVGGG